MVKAKFSMKSKILKQTYLSDTRFWRILLQWSTWKKIILIINNEREEYIELECESEQESKEVENIILRKTKLL